MFLTSFYNFIELRVNCEKYKYEDLLVVKYDILNNLFLDINKSYFAF